MEYKGKVYRPWMEANSLLIQTTYGCSHNTCTFCTMFDDKRFGIRKIEDIFADIEEARTYFSRVESIFLIDGNVLAIKTEMLLQILHKIKDVFPECKRVSMYAAMNDLRRKSINELTSLREAGLALVYAGLESGDRVVLEKVRKQMTPEQAIEGMEHAKAAGIEVLLSIIYGLGGKYRSKEHIEETVKILNIMKPEQIAPMTLTVQPRSVLEKEVQCGDFIQATTLQIMREEEYLLKNLGNFKTFYWGDHSNNITFARGYMPDNRERFLKNIREAIALDPIASEEVYETMPW